MPRKQKYIFQKKTPQMPYQINNIEIIPVQTKNQFKQFYNCPFSIYQNDHNWVAPFWVEQVSFFENKNPFWNHASSQLFLAKKNTKIVGRIAGIVDSLFQIPEADHVGFFGFFETINDSKTATALLTAAEQFLQQQSCTSMIGPIQGRIDMGAGFLIKGYESPPPVLCPYNPPYYSVLAQNYGMNKIRDFLMYNMDLTQPIPLYIKKAADRCNEHNITLRGFNRWKTGKELRWWVELLKNTFSTHWGYVPVSNEEVRNRFGIKQARWFIDTDLFLVAEKNGHPIAFKWSTPDYNQILQKMKGKIGPIQILQFLIGKKTITKGRLNYVGIKKEARLKGLGSCMNYYVMEEMKKRNYTSAACGPIDEKNTASLRTIEKTGAQPSNMYRIFQKKI